MMQAMTLMSKRYVRNYWKFGIFMCSSMATMLIGCHYNALRMHLGITIPMLKYLFQFATKQAQMTILNKWGGDWQNKSKTTSRKKT